MTDPGAGPFPHGYGAPVAAHGAEDIPIDLVPSVQDWGEARQEAERITRALLSNMDCTSPIKFERACRRILTYYLVTGHLPDRDAMASAGELGLPDAPHCRKHRGELEFRSDCEDCVRERDYA